MHSNPFVASKAILSTLGMANIYQCRPSVLLGLREEYEAYCFDEACAYIKMRMQEGAEPVFKKQGKPKRYKTASDLYKDYGFN